MASSEVIVREFVLSSTGRARSGLEIAMYLESELDISLCDADIVRLETILANASAGEAVDAVLALVSRCRGTADSGSRAGPVRTRVDGHG